MGVFSSTYVFADNSMRKSVEDIEGVEGDQDFLYEVGLSLGGGYYMGDAAPYPFMNPREVLGAQFRYKFGPRWAIQAKVQRQRIAFRYPLPLREDGKSMVSFIKYDYENPMYHADIVAEFNFFRFGGPSYDYRVKNISPYIALGFGFTKNNKVATHTTDSIMFPLVHMRDGDMQFLPYIPIGIGVKWKFAKHWQLHAVWQHQIYLMDNIEGFVIEDDLPKTEKGEINYEALKDYSSSVLNNSHELNGMNIFNNDVLSTLTVSIIFEFGTQRYSKYTNQETAVSSRVKNGKPIYAE